jgi:hypothetical protein
MVKVVVQCLVALPERDDVRVLPANPLDIADAVSMRILVGWICDLTPSSHLAP